MKYSSGNFIDYLSEDRFPADHPLRPIRKAEAASDMPADLEKHTHTLTPAMSNDFCKPLMGISTSSWIIILRQNQVGVARFFGFCVAGIHTRPRTTVSPAARGSASDF